MVESRMWKKEEVFTQKKGTLLQEDTGEWFALFPGQKRRNGHLKFKAGKKRFLEKRIKDMAGSEIFLFSLYLLEC